tara:strand:- start:4836 stop:5498 length:663 start_codon:yes stop_codon:yes gene_type:complete
MKASELINNLTKMKEKYGDIMVLSGEGDSISDLSFVNGTQDEDILDTNGRLFDRHIRLGLNYKINDIEFSFEHRGLIHCAYTKSYKNHKAGTACFRFPENRDYDNYWMDGEDEFKWDEGEEKEIIFEQLMKSYFDNFECGEEGPLAAASTAARMIVKKLVPVEKYLVAFSEDNARVLEENMPSYYNVPYMFSRINESYMDEVQGFGKYQSLIEQAKNKEP